jgi:ABC-type uncharacterized transport system auxiliary subunit
MNARTVLVARVAGHLLTMVLAAGAVGGCLSASVEPRYYALAGVGMAAGAAPSVVENSAAPWPVSIVVARFETRFVYDRLELVYRPSARELRFDAYRLWASKPGRMLSDAVAEHLRGTGRFAAVSARAGAKQADFELRAEVLAIEEIDVDKTHWKARLAMRFELVALPGDEVVWRHAFATERAVRAPHPAEVVGTLDAILADELLGLDAGLAGYFGLSRAAAPSE